MNTWMTNQIFTSTIRTRLRYYTLDNDSDIFHFIDCSNKQKIAIGINISKSNNVIRCKCINNVILKDNWIDWIIISSSTCIYFKFTFNCIFSSLLRNNWRKHDIVMRWFITESHEIGAHCHKQLKIGCISVLFPVHRQHTESMARVVNRKPAAAYRIQLCDRKESEIDHDLHG